MAGKKVPPPKTTTHTTRARTRSQSLPSNVTKKRKATPPPSKEPLPIWDQGIASRASRERKRFKLCLASLHEDIDEGSIAKQADTLVGESKNSWGIPGQDLIKASRRPRCRGRDGAGKMVAKMAYMANFGDLQPERAPTRPNCLSRSPILRVPLEVREAIYAYLLIYPLPIRVKDDFTTLERNSFVDHSLLLVCKQFAIEATKFIYRHNTFHSLIRETPNILLGLQTPKKLPTKFHPFIRNIVIDCSKACWNLDWCEKAADGLHSLFMAEAVINTLTLMVVPQRVQMSTTEPGNEVSTLTFADFLRYPGRFMEAVRRLAPKTFRVVVKKSGNKKLGMDLDLTPLRTGTFKDNILANEETMNIRGARLSALRRELLGLKNRFEEVFDNENEAVSQGICYLISTEGKGTSDDLSGRTLPENGE